MADPPWQLLVQPVEVWEVFIEILPLDLQQRVVTVIEVLSPSKKQAGSDGRKLYLEKQRELLASGVSLLEIDLLRGGVHTVAAPL